MLLCGRMLMYRCCYLCSALLWICSAPVIIAVPVPLELPPAAPEISDIAERIWIRGKGNDILEDDILEFDIGALVAQQKPRKKVFRKLYRRNAVIFTYFRWPDGVIPFVFDPTYNKSEKAHILNAMNEFHLKTCIRFVPRKYHTDYLSIIKFRGCASKIGRQGGRQPLYLSTECLDPKRPGIVVHELMHGLGFLHEQTRHDRDDFIAVIWNNIAPDHQDNFAKVDERLVGMYDAPYDYGSVMHYGPNFFAVNYSNPTIIPKKPTKVLGQRTRLSDGDAKKINTLYNCKPDNIGVTLPAMPSESSADTWEPLDIFPIFQSES